MAGATAPALTRADLSIAIGGGTDIAIESAGLILVNSNPMDAVKIFKLSRASYNYMIQNLWWAAGYNIFASSFPAGVLAKCSVAAESYSIDLYSDITLIQIVDTLKRTAQRAVLDCLGHRNIELRATKTISVTCEAFVTALATTYITRCAFTKDDKALLIGRRPIPTKSRPLKWEGCLLRLRVEVI